MAMGTRGVSGGFPRPNVILVLILRMWPEALDIVSAVVLSAFSSAALLFSVAPAWRVRVMSEVGSAFQGPSSELRRRMASVACLCWVSSGWVVSRTRSHASHARWLASLLSSSVASPIIERLPWLPSVPYSESWGDCFRSPSGSCLGGGVGVGCLISSGLAERVFESGVAFFV